MKKSSQAFFITLTYGARKNLRKVVKKRGKKKKEMKKYLVI
jgi:hypothetical protein